MKKYHLWKERLIPHWRDRFRMEGQFLDIARPLLLGAFGPGSMRIDNGNLILVASARPREGRTFTAINLAIAIAKEGRWPVVLADSDFSTRVVSRIFGLADKPGLTDLFADPAPGIRDVIYDTDLPGLSVLPAGKYGYGSGAHALYQGRLDKAGSMLAQHATRSVVILDTPPLLTSRAGAHVSRVAGQIVFVVRSGVTSRRSLQRALAALDSLEHVKLVMNRAKEATPDLAVTQG